MEGPHIYPGLRQRALAATVQAQRRGDAPPDWDSLFPMSDPPVAPSAINRALASLAEAGLITGVWTSDGWLQVQATPRGAAQAGRAAQPERSSVSAPSALTTELTRGWRAVSERLRQHSGTQPLATQATLVDTVPTAATVALSVEAPARSTAQPVLAGLLALRAQLAQVWRTFTTFP